MSHTRDYYLEHRQRYLPQCLSLIVIAESPPASGKYFYDERGRITEPLFSAMMRDLLEIRPTSKREGLVRFQEAGYILVDSTYHPVNSGFTIKQREERILNDFPRLVADLLDLEPSQKVPLLLLKANICRLLEPRLAGAGFEVLNHGVVLPFPSSGQQGNFSRALKKIVA